MFQTNQTRNLRPNLFNLLVIVAAFMFVTACVYRSDKSTENNSVEPPQNSSTPTDKQSPKTTDNKRNDNGDFLVEHVPVKNSRYDEIDKQIKEEKLLERAADKLNRSLMLPYNITLRTQDCDGDSNAYYSPRDHSITVCYELMEHFYKLFRSTGMDENKAYDKMFDAVRFAFLHELGHAVIDAYKLPIVSNEEDAADRCSSYICLTELGDEGVKAVLAAADGFAIESKNSPSGGSSMADEHLLQEQRFYNTLCMIYGSDTGKYDYFVTENYLPRARAVRCPNEYERTVQSWGDLFKPWRKE